MNKIGAREARSSFSDVLNRAAYGKQRIVLTKNGKDVAAIVPIEDLEFIETLEDQIDVAEAKKIRASKSKTLDWNTVKKQLRAGRGIARQKAAAKK